MSDADAIERVVTAHDHAIVCLDEWRQSDRQNIAALRMACSFAGAYEQAVCAAGLFDDLDERERLTLQTAGRGFAARLRRLLAQSETELLDQAAEQLLNGVDLTDVL